MTKRKDTAQNMPPLDWKALTQEIEAAWERLYRLEEAAEEDELDCGEEDMTANTCISLDRIGLRTARLAARDAVLAHRRGNSADATRLYAEAYQGAKFVAR